MAQRLDAVSNAELPKGLIAAEEVGLETAAQEIFSESPSLSTSLIGNIHVEELEPESVDVQDIEAEGVKLAEEEESSEFSDEDV
jgi:hypothetical protein